MKSGLETEADKRLIEEENVVLLQTVMYMAFCFTWVSAFMTVLTAGKGKGDICRGLCFATIVWSVYLFALTELLSAFHLIAKWPVFAGWAAFVLIQLFYCWKNRPALARGLLGLRRETARMIADIRKGPKLDRIGFLIIAVMLLVGTYLALATVAYNWDSMTYHLARIMFWIEHGSVAYFDSNVMRQVFSPVFAEYINLHAFVLTGGDVFANMAQDFSLYGVCILVYGIMRRMGISRGGRILGILILLNTQIVFAESISTQVDMVGTLYLIILVYLLLDVLDQDKLAADRKGILHFAAMGLDCGLIYITKTNACIPAAVVILFVIVVKLINRESALSMAVLGGISTLLAALLAAPSSLRNYLYVGDIFAKEYIGTIVVGTASPKYLLLNILKSFCSCTVKNWNQGALLRFVYNTAEFLKADINKSQITFEQIGRTPYHIFYSYQMDYAGAPVMMMLLLPALVLMLWLLLSKRDRLTWLSAVFVLQFAVLLGVIKWQPWISRLLLPSIVLLIVPIVYAYEQLYEGVIRRFGAIWRRGLLVFPIVLVLLCLRTSAYAFMFHNGFALRNILGEETRNELYHAGRRNHTSYMHVYAQIDENGYKSVGLFTSWDSYQYPILVRYVPAGIEVENVYAKEALLADGLVYNNGYDFMTEMNPWFHPDAIFVADVPLDIQNDFECNGNTYRCVFIDPDNSTYSLWEKIPD